MLEQLFGSQTRIKLLQHFLSNPEDRYYVRELTRILDSQINAIRRELTNLEKMGIISIVIDSEDKGKSKTKRKFYQVNSKFILHPELKSIFEKAHFLLEKKFAQALQKIGKVHYLVLTGAFVGDKELPIDLMVVGKLSKANRKKFEKILKNFQKNMKREINYTLFSKDEFEYRRSVADRFLYAILDAEKIVLIDEIFNLPEPKLIRDIEE